MRARAIMVLGTASDVGKSLVVTALCRRLAKRGIRVAPFKAQNMSLNSAATPEGGEIGRAQALQAEAAGIPPSVDMNPVLLKPTSDIGSQVILRGRVLGTYDARTYQTTMRHELFGAVRASYERLARQYDVVVLEGAGSPAEINLRAGDIANLEMAHAADARCLLVGDIDRGGVFAALLGTLELLDARDRARIAAFAINKFRGDASLLAPGIAAIEPRLRIPCAGVIPYLPDVGLDEEDSVVLERLARRAWRPLGEARLRIAVVQLPYLSNFTDFDPLAAEPSVDLRYVRAPDDLRDAHVVIIPGTKSTLADLAWLRECGLADAIVAVREQGLVFGICGGLQMLGTRIDDPHGLEGGGTATGLGLLDVQTTLDRCKTTRTARGSTATGELFGVPLDACPLGGYEIHLGRTRYGATAPFATIVRTGDAATRRDGAVSADGRIAATYLHGLFASDAFRHAFVRAARAGAKLPPALAFADVEREREARLDRVAHTIGDAIALDALGDARWLATA